MDTSDHTTPLRKCTKCGNEYPATTEYFHKAYESLRGDCRDCYKARKRKYRLEHIEEARERSRRYGKEHPEASRKGSRLYYQRHRNLKLAKTNAYRQTHIDQAREYARQYRREHLEAGRAIQARRRARKIASGGSFTVADIELQLKTQKRLCWYCGVKLVGKDYHIDHRVPLSRGGSNAPENLCIACPTCNLSKNDKLPHEWGDRLL